MILKPNCKINLGLNIVRKRADGYHDIESLFYPVGLCDTLEVNAAPGQETVFSSSGIRIPGDRSSNLCVKAYHLLNEYFGIPAVEIRLEKNIPVGAGLGGGSTDGAFTLIALNEIFALGLDRGQLKAFASMLGSDCSFFIANEPAFARGRGEILEKMNVDLSGYHILLVIPPVHISTSEAYSMISAAAPVFSLKETAGMPVETWKGRMSNAFEPVVAGRFPVIRKIKDLLYENGAVYASMSGSGSAVYGLFREVPRAEGLFPSCFVWASGKL